MSPGSYCAKRGWGLATAFWLVVGFIPPSLAEGIRTDELTIPALVSGPQGPAVRKLEAITIRPDDSLPHPLAVLSHGSPRDVNERRKMSPYGLWAQATAFARRGWIAVVFMRRGYGRSEGTVAGNYTSCTDPDYVSAGRADADEIAAVAKFMETQPYVSQSKWISVGVSAGGFATVALTADPPPGLEAAIVFAPGRGSRSPDTVCGERQLVSAFSQFGRTSRVPLLWVSAPNDHFFGPALVQEFTAAFAKAGGNLTFIQAPSFGTDGHHLFSRTGMPVWLPMADRFLTAQHLTWRNKPIDLPLPDVAMPANLPARGRDAFKTYLESGPHKAFAASSDSHFGWISGRRSPDEARHDALETCAKYAPGRCAVVNVDNKPLE